MNYAFFTVRGLARGPVYERASITGELIPCRAYAIFAGGYSKDIQLHEVSNPDPAQLQDCIIFGLMNPGMKPGRQGRQIFSGELVPAFYKDDKGNNQLVGVDPDVALNFNVDDKKD